MSEKQILDLESMMDETLDGIPEAPDFTNPPSGEYILQCTDAKIVKKDKDGVTNQTLQITIAVQETLSTLNNEPPVPNGSLFTERFQGTADGLSYFKKRIREIMGVTDVTGVSLGDMMNSAKGQNFKARISYRTTEGKGANAGKKYENLNMNVVKAA